MVKTAAKREYVQYWEQAYAGGAYRQHWEYDHPSPELAAMVAGGLPRRIKTVLDIGCGAGREAVFLAQCGYRVIGVDISSQALAIAEGRALVAGVEVDWRQGSVLALPVETGSIGFINDRGLLHLIPERQRGRVASEIRRVLKPGGIYMVRGADATWGREFTPITLKSLNRHFPSAAFKCGPVLPIRLISNAGARQASIAVLTKK